MPNIKPVSDLRNYSAVPDAVSFGAPVYLTRNGRGCYTILSISEQEELQRKVEQYDKIKAELQLMCELNAGRKSGEEEWIAAEEVSFCLIFVDKQKSRKIYD